MDTLTSFFRSLDACAWRESNMAAYLVCLTTDGGIPLFTRTKGNLPQLPFPVIGSLNGVCMFASNQDVSLLNTITDDAKVVWKVFNERITLIMVTSDDCASDLHLNRLLDFVFNSMVLFLGINELTNIRNVELLKRDLRCCYSLIDSLLEGTDLTGNITQALDVILCPDVSLLQEFLDDFATAVNSEFGCLLVMGKVAVATERWWELTGLETVLLSFLLRALPPCSSRDIPVYLPYGSPKVPHRLLSFQLIEGVEVCVICGPKPSLQDTETKFLDQYWRLATDTLKSSRRSHPRNLPADMVIDSGILGFLLVNTDERKCLSGVHPSGVMTEQSIRRWSVHSQDKVTLGVILQISCWHIVSTTGISHSSAGYKQTILHGHGWILSFINVEDKICIHRQPSQSSCDLYGSLPHQAMETYICSSHHKCYAVRNATHELYLLFAPDVPNYALGKVS